MTGNDGTGNIPERDLWETKQELFDKLDSQYIFQYDCCADIKNKKCVWYSDRFETCNLEVKGLMCWMNPPFSKALEMFRHFFKVIPNGVAIYRCDNFETKIWQEVIFPNASWVFIPNKRIAYEGMEGSGSRFPSALIGFNVPLIESLVGITLKPFGSFNMGDKVSATPTPKEATLPSHHPNITFSK